MATTAHSSALDLGNQFQQTSEQGENSMQISNANINMQQHSNAENIALQNPLEQMDLSSITESGQQQLQQELVENKSPPKSDISATSVVQQSGNSTIESSEQNKALSDEPSMSVSTEEPIKLSPKLSDDSKVNAVSEKKTKKATKIKHKPVSSVSSEPKKRKRKTTDPADQGVAKKHRSNLQQKLFESVNTFYALGKKTSLTSQIREPKEQAQNQCPKPPSPKRGQVQTNSRNQQQLNHSLAGVSADVKKRPAPSSSTTAPNIQSEAKIKKSPPRREEKWEDLLDQLEFSIPLPPEERETLKRKAQREREMACQYTAKGRVQFFKQRQRDMDISLYYGYLQ
ncbi:hypothetical protein XENTR_v10023918 [Xenopus tropicalis]|nr:hypothetical protein XENTR_v10023918 [Xenopus tropicalis]